MIRILHTADWHLGQTFFGYDRAGEHEVFLNWLAGEIREREIDALIIAGDVFDVSNPSAASQSLYYHFIYRVTAENPTLQIVIVAGNHDSAARLEAPLPLLQAMRTEVRGVVRKSDDGEIDYDHLTVELKNRDGEVELLCMAVPFLRQGDYPTVPTEGNPYAEGVRELYTQLLQRLWKRRKENQSILAIGHLQAIGSEIAEKDYSERTVIVNGVSKAYAMTGWRIGFIAGPEWIVKACNKLQGQYTSGPCSVSQKAAEAAYTGTQEPVKEMQKAFERRRDLIVKLAKEVPGFEVNVPQGAFYLFPKCSYFFGKSNGERKIENSDDLAMYLLEDAHVACVGGTSFGAPECIRMSYATSDENIVEAIRRIKEALAKLK